MIKELPEDPQQEPIADAFVRAAVEVGAVRRWESGWARARAVAPVERARMTHHLDQSEAEMAGLPDDDLNTDRPYGGRYLPVDVRGVDRLRRYGIIRDIPDPTA